MWKSRWTSWAPLPNKPTVSVDVKQHSTKSHSVPGATNLSSHNCYGQQQAPRALQVTQLQPSHQSLSCRLTVCIRQSGIACKSVSFPKLPVCLSVRLFSVKSSNNHSLRRLFFLFFLFFFSWTTTPESAFLVLFALYWANYGTSSCLNWPTASFGWNIPTVGAWSVSAQMCSKRLWGVGGTSLYL